MVWYVFQLHKSSVFSGKTLFFSFETGKHIFLGFVLKEFENYSWNWLHYYLRSMAFIKTKKKKFVGEVNEMHEISLIIWGIYLSLISSSYLLLLHYLATLKSTMGIAFIFLKKIKCGTKRIMLFV